MVRRLKRLAVPVLVRLKAISVFAVHRSGLSFVARHTWARRKVGILVYHNPSPETLDRHLEWLTARYSFITLDALVEALRSGRWDRLPPRSLVLTIDDGHLGNLELIGVLERHAVHATMFVCSQIVDTRRGYWWTVPGIDRVLLRRLSNGERLRILSERHGFTQTGEVAGERPALSAEEMARFGDSVDFQAHTRFHPFLPRCDDEEAVGEIEGCKSEVERLTGKPCRHFSYPNGLYGERELALVRSAGYASARTTDTGWVDASSDPYRLKIVGMPDDASLDLVASQLTGLRYLRELMYYF